MTRSGPRLGALFLATSAAVLVACLVLFPSGLACATAAPAARIHPRFGHSSPHPVTAAPLSSAYVAWRLRSLSPFVGLPGVGSSASDGTDGVGYTPEPLDLQISPSSEATLGGVLPGSFDLRTAGKLTPIRDQGSYGTCWAFATFGSLESSLLPSDTEDFSEDNLALGSDYYTTGTDLYNQGGNALMATAYLARWAGPVSESDEPYGTGHLAAGLSARKHVQDVIYLPTRTGPADNSAIKNALTTYGAVDVSMYADTNRYYNATSHAYYYNGTAAANHDVDIVGWNDSYAASNFNSSVRPSGNGAWIVRNSWGTSFGEAGYFYVSYYDSVFANDTDAVFENADPPTNYGAVLQYDTLGETDAVGLGNTTGWFMNKFTVSGASSLRAVSFYADAANAPYYVYESIDGQALTMVTSGVMANAGYHTVQLPSAVSLPAGTKFDVAVQITTPSCNWPIPIEAQLVGYSDQATATAGQGYVSEDGVSWYDLTSYSGFENASVCLKAFVDPVSPGTLTGTVSSASGGLAGVSVAVPGYTAASTAADGSYSVSTITPGTYSVTYSKSGYVSQTLSVTINAGATTTRDVALAPAMKPVYRFRSLRNGSYLWSADESEKANISARLSSTWLYEGVAYQIDTANPLNSSPLWRFVNITGDHYLYSADPVEKASIIASLSKTWRLEGQAYTVSTDPSGAPVWRFRNKKNGTYLYSADAREKDAIANTMSKTWQLEGPAYYLAP